MLAEIFFQFRQPPAQVADRIALHLDQNHRFGITRQQLGERPLGIACDLQQSPIHQIASDDAMTDGRHRTTRGRIEPMKKQQRHAAMRRHLFGLQRGIGDQAECPLGAGQQFGQMDDRLRRWLGFEQRVERFDHAIEPQSVGSTPFGDIGRDHFAM